MIIDERDDKTATRLQAGEETEGEGRVLAPKAQETIGRLLRASYDKVAAEPLPDKFLKLLEQLSNADKSEKRE